MPRGPHPADADLFGAQHVPALREAASHMAWLLERGYAEPSTLKLVGDRFALRERQRTALRRSVAATGVVAKRRAKRVAPDALRGRRLAVDGFNGVIVLESALSGGVLLRGLDGALRDLASVHGSYRRMERTFEALAGMAETLARWGPAEVCWVLDRPVSNSGRLRQWILDAAPPDLVWTVTLEPDADAVLMAFDGVVASGDAWILDSVTAWFDLPAAVIAERDVTPWIVDIHPDAGPSSP